MNLERTCIVAASLVLAVAVFPPALAEAELVLEDGQVLSGLDVELKDGVYTLELETGSYLSLPAALVKEVRLTGGEEEREEEASTGPPARPEILAGPPEPVREPTPAEQLAVFREPAAAFQRNLVDHTWRPESDWDMDPERNNFRPTRWIEAPFDNTWKPVNAYSWDTDVTTFNQARWQKSVIDPIWHPVNGFR
jgi:hypothetical protein